LFSQITLLTPAIIGEVGCITGCGGQKLPTMAAGLLFTITVLATPPAIGAGALFVSPNLAHPGMLCYPIKILLLVAVLMPLVASHHADTISSLLSECITTALLLILMF